MIPLSARPPGLEYEGRHAANRRFLLVQVALAIPVNALLGALFVWIVFGGQARVALWGVTGLAADLVPTTFMITLMTTIGLTLATRSALQAGKLHQTVPRRLPRSPIIRGLTFALVATFMLVPVTVLALWLIWSGDWRYTTVLWFKIAYVVLLGLMVTPVIVLSALSDGARKWTP